MNGQSVDVAALSAGDKLQLGPTLVLRFDLIDDMDREFHNSMLRASSRDALTGIFNRTWFETELIRELSFASRMDADLSVALVDIDRFKVINDTLGHRVGDAVLTGVTRAMQRGLRRYDVLGRWGGDEFAILLRSANVAQAATAIARVSSELRSADLGLSQPELQPTLSIGIVSVKEDDLADLDSVIELADVRLYAAKNAGRDGVVSSGHHGLKRKSRRDAATMRIRARRVSAIT